MLKELAKYLKENLEVPKYKAYVGNDTYECCALMEDKINDIDNYLENNNDFNNFQTLLFNYIDKRHLKDSDVYNKVHLDRRLFSKIRSDINYHPSKETVLLLGISLELTEEEIIKLLESASYALPKNNYFDLIMRFCFINKIYNLTTINEYLDTYHCKLLGI